MSEALEDFRSLSKEDHNHITARDFPGRGLSGNPFYTVQSRLPVLIYQDGSVIYLYSTPFGINCYGIDHIESFEDHWLVEDLSAHTNHLRNIVTGGRL